METNSRETLKADFDAFDISEELGFLLEEPLVSCISFLIQQTILSVFFSQNWSETRLQYGITITMTHIHLFTIEDYFLFPLLPLYKYLVSSTHTVQLSLWPETDNYACFGVGLRRVIDLVKACLFIFLSSHSHDLTCSLFVTQTLLWLRRDLVEVKLYIMENSVNNLRKRYVNAAKCIIEHWC